MTTATLDFDNLTLTSDQQSALDAFYTFLVDPVETVFVLRGYSGCGKSTLVRTLLDRLPAFQKAAKLINPSGPEYVPELTATTNKAAENLAHITGYEVKTIHSALGLLVQPDVKTKASTLKPRRNAEIKQGVLLFIDEASYIDSDLLGWIFKQTQKCKIVFIGDPAQLAPVKSSTTPVFDAGFGGAELTQVVRQAAGNPIVDLATMFRNTVNTGVWTPFKPDGHHIQRLSRGDFLKAIEAEFTRPDWRYSDSKILGWTNKCVVDFNDFVRRLVKGNPDFQVGDYAICNSFITPHKGAALKTDQLVLIEFIGSETTVHGVVGNYMLVSGCQVFQPKSLASKNEAIKAARARKDWDAVFEMEQQWIDLRGAYACTINKAQGSTFDKVYIDLADISRCHQGETVARMLYVGTSRARNHVYLTGDLA